MAVEETIKYNDEWMERSGYKVRIDAIGNVEITNGVEEETIYIQGWEADRFIEQVEHLYNTYDVTWDECLSSVAKPYVENLA